ncbi:MAG: collagenase [Ehrlichia sp.]
MPIFLEHGVNTDKFSNQGVVKDYLDLKHDVLNKTYNIEVKKLNLNVEVHSKNVFSETEKNVIRDHIHNAVNDFMEYVYCLPASSPLSKVEIYLIDNVDEYKQYCVQYGLLCDGGNGITYMGDQVTPYRIYLYKEGDSIVGLRHELSYVLQDHVTGHKLAGSVNRNLMLCVISNAIADFCEYGHSVSDQICAELRVFNKICGSGEFDKHTDRSIIDILKELKYHHCKDIEPTIRDFGFAFLNFAKKVAGGDFSTFLLSLIKRGDTSTLDKILDYLVSPINNSLFKQSVEEQLGRLEWVYKDKYKIPQNVKLQYVANDGADIDIEAGRKLHVVKYTHFGDKKTVPTVTCSALSNVIGRLCDFASFSEEKQLAVGLSGSANTSSRYYDTPPVYPMKENVSNLDKKCPDASLANSMNADLNPEKFKNDVFYHVRTIRNDDLKLNLEIHTPQDLPHKRFREIEKGLNDTIEKFKSSFGLEPNDRDTTFELYLFDNKEQYEYYGQLYNLRINGSGGKTFYGNPDLPYKIYVHKFGEILNLKHELAHALESYACGHRVYKVGGNGRIFSEGIAEYIQDDNSFILENIKNKEVVFNVLHGKYDNMDEAIRAATGDKQHLQYSIGQAFVTFLQDKYPGVISEYFRASKTGNFERARELISMDKYSDFEHWVKSKDVYLHLEDMNILKLEIGDKLLSYDNARVSEASGKHNEYYSEKICDIHGKVVGEILPVAHYSASNVMRSWNVASGDEMQVGPEYNYLKLVNAPSGKSAYVYCDKDGKEYFNDKSYIDNVFNILKKI